MMSTPKFFLTHSWHDIEFARRLFNDLKAQGLEGFFDDKALQGGHRMAEEINRGLEWCDVYIPVLSNAALESPWCWEEINAAISLSNQRKRNGRPRVIPVLIEDCEVPALLSSRLYFNFTNRYEDALKELLGKGLGAQLKFAPSSAAPSPLVSKIPMPALLRKNWLLSVSAFSVVMLAIVFFISTLMPGAISQPTPMRAAIVNDISATPVSVTNTPGLTTTSPILTRVPSNTATVTSAPFILTRVVSPTPPQSALIIGSTKTSLDGATMIYVPANYFQMGSKEGDDDEKPEHSILLLGFWIDKYEVTNALYKKCVAAGRCSPPNPTSSIKRNSYYGNAQYDNYPVIQVAWNDANAYCAWAGKKLPTEAQWEKTARGTDTLIYPWGNTFDRDKLNSLDGGKGDTTPVGSYSEGASPYGAMDMAGNVWEWVADWYDPKYYKPFPTASPKNETVAQNRVIRGGSWNATSYLVRTANRSGADPEYTGNDLGFRCVE